MEDGLNFFFKWKTTSFFQSERRQKKIKMEDDLIFFFKLEENIILNPIRQKWKFKLTLSGKFLESNK